MKILRTKYVNGMELVNYFYSTIPSWSRVSLSGGVKMRLNSGTESGEEERSLRVVIEWLCVHHPALQCAVLGGVWSYQ